ncbi:hypothetical protein [Pedobacter frigoris]|uniref:Uncharacterized protein n=1 Tax=Pedobacter frigoris TaxID=2571272 RepID=A0A4U1CH51_9SPHI|nr:hypothetical protein [Pedobacter frigoris]TKC06084.1 hypothetical protein FA047_12185 [Pedobacter frigoris]
MKKYYASLLAMLFAFASTAQVKNGDDTIQAAKEKSEAYFPFVKSRALEVMKTGVYHGETGEGQ